MRRSILTVSALVLSPCLGATLAAQVSAVQPGTRVRITLGGVATTPITAVLDAVTGDTIRLRTSDSAKSIIPLGQVWRVEVSEGRKRPLWSKTAPLWMPLAAGAVGAGLAYSTDSGDDFFGRDFAAVAGGVLGGVVGLIAGVGTAIGVKTEQWKTIPTTVNPARAAMAPRPYLAPGARGLNLGVRARF